MSKKEELEGRMDERNTEERVKEEKKKEGYRRKEPLVGSWLLSPEIITQKLS